MKILGIETSCDETAAAVVSDGRILSNVVSSQVEAHGRFYGVVPELASRAHQQKIASVIADALQEAFPGSKVGDLPDLVDAVAFTQGPGLTGALLVGKTAAKTLSWTHELPLIGVNHLEGHAFAVEFVRKVEPPFLALIVSGGHTDLVLVRGPGRYRVLGRTRDDAAGEAFDKVAKLLKIGFPGGPVVDRMSRQGDPQSVKFPRPFLPGTWDFSFSGLKTAVLYHTQRFPKTRSEDICASFQEAIVETLVEKTLEAARNFRVKSIVIGGGVAANSRLREMLSERAREQGFEAHWPPPGLCTDNGAMIALVAEMRFRSGRLPKKSAVDPSMRMRNW